MFFRRLKNKNKKKWRHFFSPWDKARIHKYAKVCQKCSQMLNCSVQNVHRRLEVATSRVFAECWSRIVIQTICDVTKYASRWLRNSCFVFNRRSEKRTQIWMEGGDSSWVVAALGGTDCCFFFLNLIGFQVHPLTWAVWDWYIKSLSGVFFGREFFSAQCVW